MGKGGVATLPCQPHGEARPIGGDELAEGLMLVRWSAMKMARLHLAMERRDRRLVLEAMDDLVALDGRIRDFVEEIPTTDGGIEAMNEELEEQRIALAREKLILAAGVNRREAAVPKIPIGAPAEELAPPLGETAEAAIETDESWVLAREAKAPRDWSASIFALASLLLIVLAIAGAAFVFGTDPGQNVIGRFLHVMEA